MSNAALNAGRRSGELAELRQGGSLDLLVIGGGITGVGVALDAASRGLSVALIERRDLAHGTSRWSSKLVHGGLRYVAQGHLGIAYESACERSHLLNCIAPHLVHPFSMLLPFSASTSAFEAGRMRLGTEIVNTLRFFAGTSPRTLPRPHAVTALEAQALVPTLNPDGLRGGVVYSDARVEDDARLVLAVARTAASLGARILTQVAAESLTGERAQLRDERTGECFAVRARHVVNATGVWATTLSPELQLRPSKGTHLVLRSSSLGDPQAAMTVGVRGEKHRFVFALPQPDGTTYVGLTDDPLAGPLPDVPSATQDEISFLLDAISGPLRRPLRREDVIGSFAGLRPLLAESGARSTQDLSRRHAVVRGPDGVLNLVGGKLTTYRKMAQDVVDLLTATPCETTRIPLVGAGNADELRATDAPARLVRRYGTEAATLMELARSDPSLLRPLHPELPVLGVELLFGLKHEGALCLDDLLDRRLRLGLVPRDRALIEPLAQQLIERHAPTL